MAWTLPSVRATADLITAAIWNTDLKDNLILLKTSIADDGRVSGELKNFREAITTLTIAAGAITLDLSLSNTFKVTLDANITSITVSNWTASKSTPVTLRLTQDGTGGRTVALPAGWKWSYGTAPTITATLSKTDLVSLYSDDGGTTIFASLVVVSA